MVLIHQTSKFSKKIGRNFHGVLSPLYNHYTFIPREGGYQSLYSLTSGGYKNKNVIFSQNLPSIHSRCFNHNSLRSCGVRFKICSAKSIFTCNSSVSKFILGYLQVHHSLIFVRQDSNSKIGVYHFIPVKKYQYYTGIFQK